MVRFRSRFLSLSLLNGSFVPLFLILFGFLVFLAWISNGQHDLWSIKEPLSKLGADLPVVSFTFNAWEGLCSSDCCGLHLGSRRWVTHLSSDECCLSLLGLEAVSGGGCAMSWDSVCCGGESLGRESRKWGSSSGRWVTHLFFWMVWPDLDHWLSAGVGYRFWLGEAWMNWVGCEMSFWEHNLGIGAVQLVGKSLTCSSDWCLITVSLSTSMYTSNT